MSRVERQVRGTPFTNTWKAKLARDLNERGAKSELARWLSRRNPASFQSRKVQIGKILNGNTVPDGEFVLAVNDWIRRKRTYK